MSVHIFTRFDFSNDATKKPEGIPSYGEKTVRQKPGRQPRHATMQQNENQHRSKAQSVPSAAAQDFALFRFRLTPTLQRPKTCSRTSQRLAAKIESLRIAPTIQPSRKPPHKPRRNPATKRVMLSANPYNQFRVSPLTNPKR
jgi:hypothetical protein